MPIHINVTGRRAVYKVALSRRKDGTMVLAVQLIVAIALTLFVGWLYALAIDKVKSRLTKPDE
jgi:hypothetical protein